MKKIFLIRHAKSSWDEPWLRDHDRPLAQRGLKAAPIMGKRLLKKEIFPDLIISSTAERAKETAILVAKELGTNNQKIVLESSLYHAPPSTYLKVIRQQPESIQTLFLVGHNPGMTDLIQNLGVDLDNLPTAGICGFTCLANTWKEFSKENSQLIFIDYPKKST
ncbi:SixA phosphatase family protein [Algoriphagus formosus]|uniref:Histidine phosphatase family protein n=1 Tax=Algoriphagus formosus TaxID=2007308 RepID=A0A4R5V9J9_9BACT|nr:histidine phosphatase family protein [Algoriphagus aquimaris]TDK48823.1 histidine phosphatase family protein [Algoriphagus aquimaris]